MNAHILTHNLGYPRIGEKRELKKALEAFWKGEIPVEELERLGRRLRKTHWLVQKEAGLDLIPSNDFSYYDQMLDMTCLLGNVPPRFGGSDRPGAALRCRARQRTCWRQGRTPLRRRIGFRACE